MGHVQQLLEQVALSQQALPGRTHAIRPIAQGHGTEGGQRAGDDAVPDPAEQTQAGRGVEPVSNTPDLAGRKIGIYGLGAIGSRIASRAAAFEMEVGYHSRSPKPELPYQFLDSLPGLVEQDGDRVVLTRRGRLLANAITLRLT